MLNCNSQNDKFMRKEISNDKISVEWYYFSYITNNSPDFVVVKSGDNEKEIYKATDVITDVFLNDSSIVIKLFKPYRGIVFSKNPLSEIYGHKIIIDTTSAYEEYLQTPTAVLK